MRFLLTRDHKVKREGDKKGYTIGSFYQVFDDNLPMIPLCDTLEPEWRNYQMWEKKLPGGSCIMSGLYVIKMQHSRKFNKLMPFLQDVYDFKGIMIHPGNAPEDTRGCILLGNNNIKGKLTESVKAFNQFMSILEESGLSEWEIMIVD